MKTAFVAALLICCLPLEAKVLHVGERPESACRGFDGKLYVTVMNSPDTPGDGVIKVIDGDEVRVFATGLDEPKGICFTGEHLIATDLTRVWKIDASGQATVLAAADAFPHPTRFLNDVTLASDGRSVLVADTGGNAEMFSAEGLWPVDSAQAEAIPRISRIYRITPEGDVSVVIDAQSTMLNANGVTSPEPGLILVAEFFAARCWPIATGDSTCSPRGCAGRTASCATRRPGGFMSQAGHKAKSGDSNLTARNRR